MQKAVDVILTGTELMQAAMQGVIRQIANLRDGRKHAHNYTGGSDWQNHVEGACGELVVAKHFRTYWNGNHGDLKADDVGQFQVRTAAKHNYQLIVHRKDPNDKAFILVTGQAPKYKIQGWIMGADAKIERYWADPSGEGRPAFFVPIVDLKPIDELYLHESGVVNG